MFYLSSSSLFSESTRFSFSATSKMSRFITPAINNVLRTGRCVPSRSYSTTNRLEPYTGFEYFKVDRAADHVLHVEFARPSARNALPMKGWHEMRSIFTTLDEDGHFRAAILSGVCSFLVSRSITNRSFLMFCFSSLRYPHFCSFRSGKDVHCRYRFVYPDGDGITLCP